MQNPWSSYMMAPSDGSGEWEVTSPLVRSEKPSRMSYLDKVRGGGDVDEKPGQKLGGVGKVGHDPESTHLQPESHSASSSTTPYRAMGRGALRDSEGYMDAYALEGMVADTTVGAKVGGEQVGRGARDGHGEDIDHHRQNKSTCVAETVSSTCSTMLPVPSGKRAQGEGCEDESQGILAAYFSPSSRTAVLQITYLAAGFLIGEKGQSIRDMERITSTSIKSWKDRTVGGRSVRKLVIESVDDGGDGDVGMANVARCLYIIKAAVMHYKDLCEGLYCGEYVEPVRVIEGVGFHYCPPPRKSVPYAAGITVKASKVVDAYGGDVGGVPSRYKKVIGGTTWTGGAVMDILERDGSMVGRKEAVGKGSKGLQCGREGGNATKKGKRGSRKGGERGGGGGGGGEKKGETGQGLYAHPEFGLFEVPCDEDYHPKERDSARRRQRQRMTKDAYDGLQNPTIPCMLPDLPGVPPSHAWSNSTWAPRHVHPLRQQEFEVRGRSGTPAPTPAPTPFGVTLHVSPWGGNAGSAMPWTGMDTLSGVSQQSLLRGYDIGLQRSGGFDGFGGYDGLDCRDGYDRYGHFGGGVDHRRLIPSAWEDFSGQDVPMSSRMMSQSDIHDQEDRHARGIRLGDVFRPYEFRAGDMRGDHRAQLSRDSSLDNIFAEFSEKCSVMERHGRGSPRWMDTPTHRAFRGQEDVKEDSHPGTAERSRRRLAF